MTDLEQALAAARWETHARLVVQYELRARVRDGDAKLATVQRAERGGRYDWTTPGKRGTERGYYASQRAARKALRDTIDGWYKCASADEASHWPDAPMIELENARYVFVGVQDA